MEEQKPGFVVNSILPNANFGTILGGMEAVTTAKWVKSCYDGDIEHVKGIPPRELLLLWARVLQQLIKFTEWYVDVQDCARLHVACLINPGVQNERIFAFAAPFAFQ